MFILILSLLFAFLIAIFAVQNAGPVAIQLFWLTKEVPLVLIILGSAFAGALIMLLLAFWRELRLKRHQRLKPQNTVQEASSNPDKTESNSKSTS